MTGTIILYGSILLFERSINGVKPTDCCVINYLAYWLDHSSRPGNTLLRTVCTPSQGRIRDSSNFDDQQNPYKEKI